MFTRQTLQHTATVRGVGLHTGSQARVVLHPAPPGQGRMFSRNGVLIPALADFVTDTRRCTMLGHDGVQVGTVEHLLAALMLAGVDDVTIEIDAPELPVLDGAARAWHDAVMAAGICSHGGEIQHIGIPEACWIEEEESQFFLFPADHLSLYTAITIPDTIVTRMVAGGDMTDPLVETQLLRARTYGLEWEVQALLDSGLARAGSLENAVVLTHTGYLNDDVWPNEPAWHKVLDLLGDLALTGARLSGQIVAVRAGHRSHVALARRLMQK